MATQKKNVTLNPGETKKVSFIVTPTEAKTYSISVNGLSGSLVVESPPGTGDLYVILTDTNGNPLPLARITYNSHQTYTGPNGKKTIRLLDIGRTYTLVFEAENCSPETRHITITTEPQTLRVSLTCAPGDYRVSNLRITNMAFAPCTSFTVGDQVHFAANVTNLGGTEIVAFLNWKVIDPDGVERRRATSCALVPHQSYDYHHYFMTTKAGAHSISADGQSGTFIVGGVSANLYSPEALRQIYDGKIWLADEFATSTNPSWKAMIAEMLKYEASISSFNLIFDGENYEGDQSGHINREVDVSEPSVAFHVFAIDEQTYANALCTLAYPYHNTQVHGYKAYWAEIMRLKSAYPSGGGFINIMRRWEYGYHPEGYGFAFHSREPYYNGSYSNHYVGNIRNLWKYKSIIGASTIPSRFVVVIIASVGTYAGNNYPLYVWRAGTITFP